MSNAKTKEELLLETAKLYFDVRGLFMQSEERVPDMKMFLAPLIEERDALDHLMCFYLDSAENDLSDEILDQIREAQEHLKRAFFDIADFVCIRIRQYIDDVLGNMKPKQIERFWDEYSESRQKVVNFSENLSKIRTERRNTMSSIKEYKTKVIPEIFKIYEEFVVNVEKKIKTKKAD